MAVCNIDDLMADASCFYGRSPALLNALIVQLWCDISAGSQPSGGSWWNPDENAPINNPDAPGVIVNPGS